jgi:starch phosphorylase
VQDAAGEDLKISVRLPTGDVYVRIWKLEVGRISLYLLDTNTPENQLPQDRDITDSLYGGDIDTGCGRKSCWALGACARSAPWVSIPRSST